MRFARRIALVPICWTVLACSAESRASSHLGTRDTLPDGTVVVRYDGLPKSRTPPLQADLTIGVAEGNPHFVFGDIRSVDAGGDGTIYVLDYQAAEVRAFDPEGRYLRTLTRKGKGPGEITEANGMLLVGDSALWIQDHAQWMMIALDLNGEELTRVRMHVRSYGYVWNGTIDHRGLFWKPSSHSDDPRVFPPPLGLSEGQTRLYLQSYDARTDVADSIYVGDDAYRTFISRSSRGGWTYRGVPYDPRTNVIVDPAGGFWESFGPTYRIARLDARGDTAMVIEVSAPPISVTQQDRERYIADVAENSPDDRRTAEEIAALMPPFKPAVARLVMDDVGHLWVRRTAVDAEPATYDVFRADGDYAGTVTLGFDAAMYLPIRIRRGRVYAVVRDSLDIPFVVRSSPLPEAVR